MPKIVQKVPKSFLHESWIILKFYQNIWVPFEKKIVTEVKKKSPILVTLLTPTFLAVYIVELSTQRTLTYFVRGNITVPLTSCLTGLDSAVLLN